MIDQNKKILIVEDEKSILRALNKRLTEAHFNVLQAMDGEEGLEIALKESPDLIILDVLMPRMDGIAMAKKLRKDRWGKDVSILFLTNLPLHDTEVKQLQAYDYITKANIDIATLVNLVEKKLNEFYKNGK